MTRNDSQKYSARGADFPYDSWEQVYQHTGLFVLPWDTPEPHPLLVEMFQKHQAKPCARALDLGCGTGASSRLLAQAGYSVDAWDASETAIERARMLSGSFNTIRYSMGNAIKCALNRPGFYDLVLDFFFLHHIQPKDIDVYFSGIRRVLDSGGSYIVGVFVHDGETYRRPSLFSTGEVTYWSRSELEIQLRGWRCNSATYGRGGNKDLNFPMGLFDFAVL